MTTARMVYVAKRLAEKHGPIGRVAGRYIKAGLRVELMHPTRYGPAHVVCRGNGMTLVIEVVQRQQDATLETVKLLLEKAKLLRAKPMLVLYGEGLRLTEEGLRFCRENGIKVKMVRPEG